MVLQKDNTVDTKDLLKWMIVKGDAFVNGDISDPVNTATYALCVYDESADVPTLVGELAVRPNDRWLDKDPKGFIYKDKAGTEDGVLKVQLKSGIQGKTKVQVKAKGSTAGWPQPLDGSAFHDQDSLVTVQFVNDTTAMCWTSDFGAGGTKKNTGTLFKAVGP